MTDGRHWQVLAASAVGAAHAVKGEPEQDAMAVLPTAATAGTAGPIAVAVADGHGHRQHFRSRRGAQLAVEVGCQVTLAYAGAVAAAANGEAATRLGQAEVAPAIVRRWWEVVASDAAATPLSDDEAERGGLGTEEMDRDPWLAYGSTLLVVLTAGRFVLCLQIGDGSVVAIDDGGATSTPIPNDARLDGVRTTSLCQTDATAQFRVGVLDIAVEPLRAVMAATDGYGNAQIDNSWEPTVGRDLEQLLRERGTAWVGANLGEWVTRCASAQGSGDDTTVALLVRVGDADPNTASAADTTWQL
ncbi:MAG: protein phosphatase 2C domain-containing protein [Acidimicrobiales bacterium]